MGFLLNGASAAEVRAQDWEEVREAPEASRVGLGAVWRRRGVILEGILSQHRSRTL